MEIRQYLSSKGLTWTEHKRPSGLQACFPCPQCGKNKFAISLEDGAYKCLSENSCGISGSWWQFQQLYDDKPQRLGTENKLYHYAQKKKFKIPQVKSKPLTPEVDKWIESRGFKKEITSTFKLGYDGKGAIMFPYFKDNVLVSVKYRAIKDKKFWQESGTEPTLFNRDKCDSNQLIIVEGEADCIALKHYDIDAVSIPQGIADNSWIENEFEWLKQFQTIFLMMDMDNAGQEGLYRIADRLGKWRCYAVKLPYKDANECLLNNVTSQTITQCIIQATGFNLPNLKSCGDFIDTVIEYNNNKDKLYGVDTGFPGLNDIIKGWRHEELSIWTGNNGSGKSNLINEIIINLARKQQKCCIASLEMTPKKLLRWLIMQVSEKGDLTNDDIRGVLTDLSEYVYVVNIVGIVEKEELLNIFEFGSRKYGIDNFFIDSMMRIKLPPKQKYEEQSQLCSDLTAFAKEHRAHMHLVAHPRKGQDDNQKPDKASIAGTGNITDLADNVFVLWRSTEEEKAKAFKNNMRLPDNILFVKKNREHGTHGAVNFNFDPSCKKFRAM